MAGLSSRFFKAGYKLPKYMLEAHGESLFNHSVKSFQKYFATINFVFIVRDVYGTPDFVKESVIELGIKYYDIVILDEETRGQAETVTLGLGNYRDKDEDITIFNIDTFRPNFEYPDLDGLGDGYLEVFQGTGDNWSFVRPLCSASTKVDLTTEKQPISDLCCTGLYYFRSVQDYFNAYDYYLSLPKEFWVNGELYVAPLYNYLIKQEKNIHYHEITSSEVVFCGVPEEYDLFLENV